MTKRLLLLTSPLLLFACNTGNEYIGSWGDSSGGYIEIRRAGDYYYVDGYRMGEGICDFKDGCFITIDTERPLACATDSSRLIMNGFVFGKVEKEK
jgi:hypothetical protein